jgi:hypothetical protein
VVLTKRKNLIKKLHTLPHGSPFGSEDLRALGVSSALASHYAKSGWIERLGRGVFMFPGDTLRRESGLKFLATKVAGLHVGAKTALAWRGVRHNVAVTERLSLWGEGPSKLPAWFVERFPARYSAGKLFSPKLPANLGLGPLPEAPEGPVVSDPERALLEMLSEVGVRQPIEEARNIMEGVRSLRSEVLAPLLRHCLRVKVIRLCVQWAEELNLPWAGEARRTARHTRADSPSRWTMRLRDGTTLILNP